MNTEPLTNKPVGTSIRRSLLWSYGAQASAMAASFVGTVVVSRLLTPYDMGLYAVALAVSGILSVLTAFGVQSYIIREHHLTRGILRAAFTVNTGLNVAVCGLLLGISWIVEYSSADAQVSSILRIMSIIPVINSVGFVPLALFTREGNFRLLSIVSFLRGIIVPATNIILVASGGSVVSLAIGPIVAECVCALFFMGIRGRDMAIMPTLTGIKPILQFGLHLVSIGGVAQIAAKASDLLLGRILGAAALGIYSRANVLATTLFFGVYGQASAILFVKMSAEMRDTGRIRETFLRAIQIITVLMWPIVVTVGILSAPVVHLLFGPQYRSAAMPLTLLMVWQFIAIGFSMNWELFVLNHETGRQARFELVRAIFGTIAFTIGSFFSITAASIGRVVDVTLGYILYRPHMDRLAGTTHGELERTYLHSGTITTITALPPLALMMWTDWDPRTSVWWIIAALTISAMSWLGLVLGTHHPLGTEIVYLTRRVRGQPRK